MSSCGTTSRTTTAPASSHAGRASSTKLSSMTQCLYGSHITGQPSSKPSDCGSVATSSIEVAGVMRSTIVLGYRTSRWSHTTNASSDVEHKPAHTSSSAALVMRCLHTSPLCGRLSQDMSVNGRVSFANRIAAAAQITPNVVGSLASGCSGSSASSSNPLSACSMREKSPFVSGTR